MQYSRYLTLLPKNKVSSPKKQKQSFILHKNEKNVVRFQTPIDRQPRNSQQKAAAYLSRNKTQKPIVMAQVVALIGLEKFSRSVYLLQ